MLQQEIPDSFDQSVIHIPQVKSNLGTRAFSVAAPSLWNLFPGNVKLQGHIVSFANV